MSQDQTPTPPRALKKLLGDCVVLLTSLVLTEPHITPKQGKYIGKLIGRIKPYLKDRK